MQAFRPIGPQQMQQRPASVDQQALLEALRRRMQRPAMPQAPAAKPPQPQGRRPMQTEINTIIKAME